MQDDSTSRRNEGRFFINSKATRVTITVLDNAEPASTFTGQLADLSLHGVKISIAGKLESGQEVKLKIEVPSMGFETERRAITRWQQPRDAKTWWTGCQLLESFDDDLVEGLAAAHVLNRRRDPRYNVDADARARWELSEQIVDVKLVNFSKGGFCIVFQNRAEFQSERLLLLIDHLGKELTVPARVMWQAPVPEGFAVGCSFVSIDGFLKVRDYAEPAIDRRRRARQYRGTRPISKWIAIALLVLAAVYSIQTYRLQPELIERTKIQWSKWVTVPVANSLKQLKAEHADDGATVPVSVSEPTDPPAAAK